jgi:hypothetical protein
LVLACEHEERHHELPLVALAGNRPGLFSRGIEGRKQDRDQQGNNANHDQKLDQRKGARATAAMQTPHELSPATLGNEWKTLALAAILNIAGPARKRKTPGFQHFPCTLRRGIAGNTVTALHRTASNHLCRQWGVRAADAPKKTGRIDASHFDSSENPV